MGEVVEVVNVDTMGELNEVAKKYNKKGDAVVQFSDMTILVVWSVIE